MAEKQRKFAAIADEGNYHKLSEPFTDTEDANSALVEFWNELYALRNKHGLANVSVIVRPRRIQRRRTKGWRKPANCRCVTRPGKFGNPFVSAAHFRTWIERLTDGHPSPALDSPEAKHMARIAASLDELRGLNLACYCGLDAECHADVLLEFANK